MKNLVSFGLVIAVLMACSTSPSPVQPPVALVPLKNKLDVKRVWQRYIGGGAGYKYLRFSPVVDGDLAYAIDHEGKVVAWNITNNKTQWKRELNTVASSAIGLDEENLYFGTSQGEVFALRKESGKKFWQTQVSSEVLSPPVSKNGVIIVRTVDGRLHALSRESGRKLWSHDRTMPVLSLRGTSTPLIVDDIVISGADNGKLAALSLLNGTLLWETAIAIPRGRNEIERLIDIDANLQFRDGIIYTVAYQGRLAAVRIDSGRLLWVRDLSSYTGMSIDSHRIYLSDAEGQVWALDRLNGATLWKQDRLLRRALSKPVIQGQYLLVGDFNSYIHWLSRENGKLLARTRLGFEGISLIPGEDDEEEDERVFSKPRNILATPIISKDMAIVINREGLVSGYRVKEQL